MKIKTRITAVLILLFMLGFYTRIAYAEPTKKILVFGDSLSAAYSMPIESGWVALLQRKIQAEKFPYLIENSSVSGETSAGGKQRLAPILQRVKPSFLILELGANDGLRGLDLTQTQENLGIMIESAQKSGAEVLLLGVKIPPNYGPAYTKQFEDMYVALAKRYHLEIVPFFLQNVAGNPEYIQADGLHPNQKAQTIIMLNVWEKLSTLLKKNKH